MFNPSNPKELLELLKLTQGGNEKVAQPHYRYVIYARKSTDEKDKQLRSLGDQISECREFASKNGLRVVDIIEESESAKAPDIRPKFRKMLTDLYSGKYDGVIAWHPDRIARNMKDAGEVIDLVDKSIIKDLKFVSFTFTNDTSGKMLLGITFVLSKEYSDKLGDNIDRGNRLSIEEGRYINKAKHGYIKDPNQHLRPDGDNFILMKNAFQLRLEGKSLAEISLYLKNNNYYRSNTPESKKHYDMDVQRLQKILKDPVYTGILMYGKTNVVDLTELYDFIPMVSVPEFMKINKLSNDSQLVKLAKSYRKGEDVKASLMKGMVFCSECEEKLIAGITTKKTKTGQTNYFYYRCDSDDCSRKGKSVRAKVLMDYIYEYLKKKPFSSKRSYSHYVDEIRKVQAQRIQGTKTKLAQVEGEKKTLQSRLENIKTILLEENSEAVKNAYKGDLEKVSGQIAENQTEIEQLTKTAIDNKSTILTFEEFIELMENMPKNMAQIKNMSELDYILRKIFLNLFVGPKGVYKITLNTPFDVLEEAKIVNGAG